MAKTTFATSDNEVKKLWEEKVFRETAKMSYFSKFMGQGADSIVQVKTQLEKDKGDRIRFTYIPRLSGSGRTSGQTLEGNEEKLSSYTSDVSLEQYRHAIRDDGDMSRQRAAFSIETEHKSLLQVWGKEKIDELCFDALQSAPTKCFYFATTTGAMTANTLANCKTGCVANAYCYISLDYITRLKTWAMTGGNRAYPPIRPVNVNGKDHYVLLVHPDVLADLKTSSAYQQAQREAQNRGKDNPIFTGAEAVWDGVVIHAHENMDVGTDGGGASVPWGQGVLMGAQALLWAWGKRESIIQKGFDYENEIGYAWGMISGVAKPVFNSLDYGSLGVVFTRTNISGI